MAMGTSAEKEAFQAGYLWREIELQGQRYSGANTQKSKDRIIRYICSRMSTCCSGDSLLRILEYLAMQLKASYGTRNSDSFIHVAMQTIAIKFDDSAAIWNAMDSARQMGRIYRMEQMEEC